MLDDHQHRSISPAIPRFAVGIEAAHRRYVDEQEAEWQERGRGVRNPLLTAVLDLRSEGLDAIKLHSGGKDPARGGAAHPIPSARTAVAWWAEDPTSNVAVVTGGRGHLAAVDLDGPYAMEWWREFEERHGPMPTRTVVTGREDGGRHLWFRVQAALVGTKAVQRNVDLAPGVQFKGARGYVVCPPSIHKSGTLSVNLG